MGDPPGFRIIGWQAQKIRLTAVKKSTVVPAAHPITTGVISLYVIGTFAGDPIPMVLDF